MRGDTLNAGLLGMKLIGEVRGKEAPTTTIKGTATGKKLVLIIRAEVSSDDEIFLMDNLEVRHR